jgi:flagellar M-ring protein FliF
MNKNITQLLQQLAAIWKQLGFNQRISIAITTLAVIGGLIGVAFWSSRTEYTLLYGKLDQEEAAKVIGALDEQKVPYQIRGGDAIMVPADKVYQVRMQMAGKGIPRGEGVGFEIFDKANFGISDFVQRANYSRAVEGELARTICQMDQVDSARVMIVMPDNQLLSDPSRKPTASVFVRVKGSGDLPSAAVNSIRFLVANSVEGLQVNNVSVVDNSGNVLSGNEQSDSISGASNDQLTARRNQEQYFSKKAEGMLEKVVGAGQAVVRVSADINWNTTTLTDEKFGPDDPIARSTTVNSEDTDSQTASAATAGGSPGTASNANANGDNTNTAAAAPVNMSHTTKKVTQSNFEINKTTSNTVVAAGGLKRISAAVFVAQQVEGSGTNATAKPRTTDEINNLKQIVQSAIGITEPALVTLVEMPFTPQVPQAMVQQMDKQEKRQFWLNLVEKMVYPALTVGVLFAFWRMFQRVKTEEIQFGPSGSRNGHGNGSGQLGNGAIPNKGLVTVEVLNQLIRENPANMTQAVRGWLGKSKNN